MHTRPIERRKNKIPLLALFVGALSSGSHMPRATAGVHEGVLPIYLTVRDPGPLPPIPNPGPDNYPNLGTPPEWIQRANPVLTTSSRIYVWANANGAPLNYTWVAISFNIDADGPVTLSNLTVFNPNFVGNGQSIRRWTFVRVPPLEHFSTEYNDVHMGVFDGYGVGNPVVQDGYTDGSPGNVLLGSFDATYTPTGDGSLWLEVGVGGTLLYNFIPGQYMQFGFGDSELPTNAYNQRSALPEITFIPEPAAAALLLVGFVTITRCGRRRSSARLLKPKLTAWSQDEA